MPEVATLLQDAMSRLGWSITDTASRIGVDRSFLSRLLSDKPPPRKRAGSRNTPAPDERYQKMAAVLGLAEDTFLAAVAREQSRGATLGGRATPVHEPGRTAPAGDRAPGAVPEDFKERYPDLWLIVERHCPLRGEAKLHDVLTECLNEFLSAPAALVWTTRLQKSTWRPAHLWPYLKHDHLGAQVESAYHSQHNEDTLICQRIAEELLGESDPGGSATRTADHDARIVIASMFYELSYRPEIISIRRSEQVPTTAPL